MNTVNLRRSPRRMATLIAIGLFLVVACMILVWVARHSEPAGLLRLLGRRGTELLAWSCAVFFGAVTLNNLRLLLDRRPQVILSNDGFFDRRMGLGKIPWPDIKGADLIRYFNQPLLALVLEREAEYVAKLNLWRRLSAQANNRLGLGFGPFVLSAANLECTPEDLVNSIHERLRRGRESS